jgi:response regulator RpfG family c-di-GMP phosphodiesterase
VEEKTRILIVDDEPCVRQLLAEVLSQDGYECIAAENGRAALDHLQHERIPIIISDIRMPKLDGLDLLREVKKRYPFTEVIMATAVNETNRAVEAMRLGAYDYVVKPFDVRAVSASVRRALERRRLLLENREYHERLEEKVREKTSELVEKNVQLRLLFLNTIESLVYTLEAKDKCTEGHSRRVSEMAGFMARTLQFSQEQVERIRLAGVLHDIGKIGVREECLNKSGRLTEEEYDEIKRHPLISERILKPIEALDDILPIIRHHHERYDGKGYPSGLMGEKIPMGSRILAIVDSYDAMISDRPYRSALSIQKTLEEIQANAGKQFDPKLVTVFQNIYESFRHMRERNGQNHAEKSPSAQHLILFV